MFILILSIYCILTCIVSIIFYNRFNYEKIKLETENLPKGAKIPISHILFVVLSFLHMIAYISIIVLKMGVIFNAIIFSLIMLSLASYLYFNMKKKEKKIDSILQSLIEIIIILLII